MSDTLNLIHRPDGTVVNETNNDPAIPRVEGYRRWWLGVDLGQSNDFTSLVLLEDECLPVIENGQVALGKRTFTVVMADRFRGVSYDAVVNFIVRVRNAPEIRHACKLSIDATGLGRPVSDMLDAVNCQHHACTMTAGQDWRREGKYVMVGKTFLVETAAVLFTSGQLKWAPDLEQKEAIEADLATFALHNTAAGNQVIVQERNAAGHGDYGIALAIAAFSAQYLSPGVQGQGKLKGFY